MRQQGGIVSMKEIFNRRSVRTYTDQSISQEDILALLKAAMQAPSAGNQQPWDFIVIQEKQNLLQLKMILPYGKCLEQSPLAIVVCGNKNYQKFEYDFWVQDCSAAIQNLLLEAVYLDLGAVWLGCYPIEERVTKVQELLSLPSSVIPLGIISIGHPDTSPEPINRFKEERIHYENWKNNK